jgi:hemerythrin
MNQITAATLHAQHQVLESLFQQLVSVSAVPGQDLTALARIMDNLITAFVQHCSDEERFMADMDYPELTVIVGNMTYSNLTLNGSASTYAVEA